MMANLFFYYYFYFLYLDIYFFRLDADLNVLNEHQEIQSFSAFNSIFNKTGLFGIYACTVRDIIYSYLFLFLGLPLHLVVKYAKTY